MQGSDAVFRTVFDVRLTSFEPEWWPLYGLLFVAVGLVTARFRPGRFSRALGGTLAVLAAAMTVTPFALHYREYRRLRSALDAGSYRLVEGTVEHFVPGRRDSHPAERFRVAGQEYMYAPAIMTTGFHQLQVDSGPMRPGLQVRIYDVDGSIARLEVRDAR